MTGRQAPAPPPNPPRRCSSFRSPSHQPLQLQERRQAVPKAMVLAWLGPAPAWPDLEGDPLARPVVSQRELRAQSPEGGNIRAGPPEPHCVSARRHLGDLGGTGVGSGGQLSFH